MNIFTAIHTTPKYITPSGFMSWFYAMAIIISSLRDLKKKELEQLANSLDENSNPLLMLVKLKE